MREERERLQMVGRQLEGRGIRDSRLREAFRRVPRHLFVPEELRASAYEDRPLAIGQGQTISQPYIVALMLELLELQGEERVLEIGTGSGYAAALLSLLCEVVYSVERFSELSMRASILLSSLGYENVYCIEGDGFAGYEVAGPYQGILLSAAPPELPETLLEQLDEGGRLVAPVGRGGQRLVRVMKIRGKYQRSFHGGVRFVPMLRGTEG